MKLIEIRTGDILFEQNKHLLAKAIRYFTKSKWSHTEIIIIEAVPLTLGAHAVGSYISQLEYRSKGKKIAIGRLIQPLPKNIREKILEHCNIKYDFISLIYYHVIRALFGKWMGETGALAAKKLSCGELVAKILNLPEWWKYHPEDLYQSSFIEIVYDQSA